MAAGEGEGADSSALKGIVGASADASAKVACSACGRIHQKKAKASQIEAAP